MISENPTKSTSDNSKSSQFQSLMARGQAALSEGDERAAHDAWRAAAMLDPTDESVWLALLAVVDNPEDMRVCRENIRIINPNSQAIHENTSADIGALSDGQNLSIVPVMHSSDAEPESSPPHRPLLLILAAILGAAIGITAAFALASII